MNLSSQRRMAAQLLKVGENKVKFDSERSEDIQEALTKDDIRALIKSKAITKKPVVGNSKARIKKKVEAKKRGRRKGHGRREGSVNARVHKKVRWMTKIRAIRDELKKMRDSKEISDSEYRKLYLQAKGNLFQSRRHLHEYIKRMRE